MKIFKTVKNIVLRTKLIKVHSFFDYSADEKAKIIRQAVRESNKMQSEIMDKYNRQFAV